MHVFWVAVGIVILVLGLLDVFLTALNYDESGFLATPLCVLQWRGFRTITRRLSRRWRPVALRQVTGLQIMLSVAAWLGCLIVGFGFIYYGLMYGTNFQYDGHGLRAGVFGAIYLSAAQLATVGTSQISPQTDALRALTIAETLCGLVLVTLILTFLLGVYQVVRDLRTLSSNFFTAERDAGDAMASLSPYFPHGQPVGLDSHLQAIADSFWSYADGLRLHHIAYYFQSGRDQFSLPYTLHMMGKTLAALRWGLPSGHAASEEPALTRLIAQFEHFADWLHDTLGWTSTAVPEVVSLDDFSAAHRSTGKAQDAWLGRFWRLNRDMARLAKLDPVGDLQEAYERYRQWLPFAYRAEQVTAAVSRDLDYQPITRGAEAAHADASRTSGWSADSPLAVRTRAWSWRVFLNRWVAVPDPGLTRLLMAAGATLAAAAAVVTLYPLFSVTGAPVLPAAMFGGMVGMYAATMPGDATAAGRKLTTVLIVLPAVGATVLGAAVASSFPLSTAVLIAVVLLGVGIGGFGVRLAALGQMAFMAYYFALLLHLRLAMLPSIVVAAIVGTIWAYLFRFVFIAERPDRILRGGLGAFRARLVLMLDPLIDAVSGARWDPDIRKRVRADLRQLRRCAAFLQGQLRVVDPSSVSLRARPGDLRQLVFDTELAANNAAEAAQNVARAGAVVPVMLRGQLAGMLDRAQEQLRHQGTNGAPTTSVLTRPAQPEKPEDDARPPEGWPEGARRLHDAIRELLRAARTMRKAQTTALADPRVGASEISAGADTHELQSSPAPEREHSSSQSLSNWLLAPTGRRAIQAAAATGLALLAGAAVASAHQYWAALAAFLVLGGTSTVEETLVKGGERIAGTIIGAVIGFWVTAVTGADPFVVLPLLAVCIFAAMYVRTIAYATMVFWITMMLALLYEFFGTLTKETLQVRGLETIIGAAIALGVAALILPIRTREKLNGDAVALLKTLDEIIQTCLKRLAGSSDIPSLSNQTLMLDQRFRQLNIRAEPLRRASGALGPDGIERRLTAAAALTYYARHLIKATETPGADTAPLTPATYTQLGKISRDNISALIQVLNKELPGPVHGSEELPLQPDAARGQREGSNADGKAVDYLVRINQTVLTLIEELTPDIAEHTTQQAAA